MKLAVTEMKGNKQNQDQWINLKTGPSLRLVGSLFPGIKIVKFSDARCQMLCYVTADQDPRGR